MATDIRPGMRVRVTRGMYAGTTGSVASLHAIASTAPYATVDVGDVCVGVTIAALEPIAETPTLRDRVTAMLKAACAQRDREAELAETRPDDEAATHEYAHALLEETIAALAQALEEGS